MLPNPSNQRKHPRYEVEAVVHYQNQLSPSFIRNLSLGGICIECEQIEDIGSQIQLEIRFPDLHEAVSILAQVIWVNGHSPKEMGLRFLELDKKKAAIIQAHLEKIYEAQNAALAKEQDPLFSSSVT